MHLRWQAGSGYHPALLRQQQLAWHGVTLSVSRAYGIKAALRLQRQVSGAALLRIHRTYHALQSQHCADLAKGAGHLFSTDV
jgi:hypothetical protein